MLSKSGKNAFLALKWPFVKIMVPHEILGKNLNPINSAKSSSKSEVTLIQVLLHKDDKNIEQSNRNGK